MVEGRAGETLGSRAGDRLDVELIAARAGTAGRGADRFGIGLVKGRDTALTAGRGAERLGIGLVEGRDTAGRGADRFGIGLVKGRDTAGRGADRFGNDTAARGADRLGAIAAGRGADRFGATASFGASADRDDAARSFSATAAIRSFGEAGDTPVVAFFSFCASTALEGIAAFAFVLGAAEVAGVAEAFSPRPNATPFGFLAAMAVA